MSVEEFAQWKVFFAAEQLHPAHEMARHAHLLASMHNGPMQRRDKKAWTPAHFVPQNPWTPPKEAKPKPLTHTALKAQVGAINRARRKK